MTNKKQTLVRVLVYLLLAFAPPFIAIFIYIGKIGWTIDSPYYSVITFFAMLCPAIANVLTRIITKEGFENAYFKFRIKGNVRYLAIALLLPVVYGFATGLVSAGVLLPSGSIDEILRKFDWMDFAANIIYVLSYSVVVVLFGFGEEFGWRGYLTPKLFELMKEPLAIIVSGIIWGLWHAPLIVCGHNFGKDYFMYPYLGIGLMCLFCVFIGFYFTQLTKASGSVIPASLAHIVNNNILNEIVLIFMMKSEHFDPEKLSVINYSVVMMVTTSVIVTVSGILIGVLSKKRLSRV